MLRARIHCSSFNGISLTIRKFHQVYPSVCSKTLNSRQEGRKKLIQLLSDAIFHLAHQLLFGGGGRVADRLSISWRAYKSKKTWQKASALSRSSPTAPLPLSRIWSWPLAVSVPTWVIPRTNRSLFFSRLKVFRIVLRVYQFLFRGTRWVGMKTGHWVSTEQQPQHGSDLNRCRTRAQLSLAVVIIPPAAPWQMALWDIGFYGRSSFISNFFSHLMRSSRSSQIQFAVWILIGLRAGTLSPPHSLSLPLFLYRRLLGLFRLIGLLFLAPALGQQRLSFWCTAHRRGKSWINMSWI